MVQPCNAPRPQGLRKPPRCALHVGARAQFSSPTRLRVAATQRTVQQIPLTCVPAIRPSHSASMLARLLGHIAPGIAPHFPGAGRCASPCGLGCSPPQRRHLDDVVAVAGCRHAPKAGVLAPPALQAVGVLAEIPGRCGQREGRGGQGRGNGERSRIYVSGTPRSRSMQNPGRGWLPPALPSREWPSAARAAEARDSPWPKALLLEQP